MPYTKDDFELLYVWWVDNAGGTDDYENSRIVNRYAYEGNELLRYDEKLHMDPNEGMQDQFYRNSMTLTTYTLLYRDTKDDNLIAIGLEPTSFDQNQRYLTKAHKVRKEWLTRFPELLAAHYNKETDNG